MAIRVIVRVSRLCTRILYRLSFTLRYVFLLIKNLYRTLNSYSLHHVIFTYTLCGILRTPLIYTPGVEFLKRTVYTFFGVSLHPCFNSVSIPSMQLFFSCNAKRIATIFPTRRRNFLGNTVASHNWSDRTFYETISERAAKFPRISRRCNAKRIPQTTHIINSHIRSANALLELRKVYGLPVVLV